MPTDVKRTLLLAQAGVNIGTRDPQIVAWLRDLQPNPKRTLKALKRKQIVSFEFPRFDRTMKIVQVFAQSLCFLHRADHSKLNVRCQLPNRQEIVKDPVLHYSLNG